MRFFFACFHLINSPTAMVSAAEHCFACSIRRVYRRDLCSRCNYHIPALCYAVWLWLYCHIPFNSNIRICVFETQPVPFQLPNATEFRFQFFKWLSSYFIMCDFIVAGPDRAGNRTNERDGMKKCARAAFLFHAMHMVATIALACVTIDTNNWFASYQWCWVWCYIANVHLPYTFVYYYYWCEVSCARVHNGLQVFDSSSSEWGCPSIYRFIFFSLCLLLLHAIRLAAFLYPRCPVDWASFFECYCATIL